MVILLGWGLLSVPHSSGVIITASVLLKIGVTRIRVRLGAAVARIGTDPAILLRLHYPTYLQTEQHFAYLAAFSTTTVTDVQYENALGSVEG
jgi:hypothetical protein